jgi:hypothetical protein
MAAGAAITANIYLLLLALAWAAIGTYLIVWATWAKGLWCRTCKKFPLGVH